MAYTKLHQSLVSSTVWREPHHTRLLWVTMMAMADKNGEVMASIPGLADMARISIPECEEALKCFLSPDPYSRSKEADGRRIEEIDGGWSLINHPKYRLMASKEDAKIKASERMARWRKRKALHTVTKALHTVDSYGVSTQDRDIAEAEAEAEAEAKKNPPLPPKGGRRVKFKKPTIEEVADYGSTLNPPFDESPAFFDFYESKGWMVGKSPMKSWKAAVRNWQRNRTKADEPKKSTRTIL